MPGSSFRSFLYIALCGLLLLTLLPASAIASGEAVPPIDLTFNTETSLDVPSEPRLRSMLATARQVLQANHASYTGLSGSVEGFYPGAIYHYPGEPVPFYLYARDTATILPAAQYLFGDSSLRTAVEEFLRLQYDDATVSVDGDRGLRVGAGAISATISPALVVNKATSVSDEETSLIHGAYRYYRAAGGSSWLGRAIAGRSVIARLNAAMDWLLGHRLDPGIGLILRAHTTDWGDVKQEPGPEPTDIGPTDEWTYSIYDQALAFAALMELSEMNRAAGQADRAGLYYGQAQALRARADEWLWMPERGYFRVHGHLSAHFQHGFDEDAIVSIGNAAALYYGLATDEQAPLIMEALERARLEAGAAKPGLTLHPPYPDGAFAALSMAVRSYQNGAIWDWWGGRQIMGELLYGNARLAKEHLALVARDWASHPGKVREWESPWLNRTSDDSRYAGAAAVMTEALVEGLFGVSIGADGVRLQPRLGAVDGSVRAYQAATNTYVAYRYSYLSRSGEIELRFGTNSPGMVPIQVLLPAAGLDWSVTLDGQPVLSNLRQVGADIYLAFRSLPGEHVALLTPAPAAQSSDSAS